MMRAVIKLRSNIKANHEVKETLRYLRLNKVNHCVLIPVGKTYDGMLQKVKDFVTWGEIKPDVLTNMIIKRGRLSGDRPITNQYIKDNTKHESLVKFAEAIVSGSCKMADLKDAKPVFRLHPPKQGFEGIKRGFNDRGSLGYRGDAINTLILKMLDVPKKTDRPKPVKKATSVVKAAVPDKAVATAAKKKPAAKAPAAGKAAAPKKAPAKKTVKKEESE